VTTGAIKVLTTLAIVTAIGLMAGWPRVVGLPPVHKSATVGEKRAYVERGLWAASGLTLSVVVAGVGSFMLLRRAREEYREESIRNMRNLLTGAREDHLRKQEDEEKDAPDA
jgi:hypothetical protein